MAFNFEKRRNEAQSIRKEPPLIKNAEVKGHSGRLRVIALKFQKERCTYFHLMKDHIVIMLFRVFASDGIYF